MSLSGSDIETINQQYLGFKKTPNLWFGDAVYGLNQFEYQPLPNTRFTAGDDIPQRLGKRVEHFVCHDLEQHPDIKLLAHNLQIQRNKQTIGELDALLLVNDRPVHLEIVYKFYVYDPTVGISERDHWIGPNRKDSLVQKLDKLKNKQLPLLFHPDTKQYLLNLGMKPSQIRQNVLFKALLFVPEPLRNRVFQTINPDCIAGSYIKKEALPAFQNCMFYLPSKCNWLISKQSNVSWLNYGQFMEVVSLFLERRQSPLIWIKHPNNNLQRCFVVWW